MADPIKPADADALVLAAPNTDEGALERLFLLEAVSPGLSAYVAADNLRAMRLMRQTIVNRLKSPAEYLAPGATTATDIITLGNQFAGFGRYPELESGLQHNLSQIVSLARNGASKRQAAYARFVRDAVTAATEPTTPPVAEFADVTAWRTSGRGSPGPRFRELITLSGNTFYATSPVPRRLPHHAKHRNAGHTHGLR